MVPDVPKMKEVIVLKQKKYIRHAMFAVVAIFLSSGLLSTLNLWFWHTMQIVQGYFAEAF